MIASNYYGLFSFVSTNKVEMLGNLSRDHSADGDMEAPQHGNGS